MKKRIDHEPLFAVGDQIKHPKYGKGYICKIDGRNYNFFYYAEFNDKTKVWLPKYKTEKNCGKAD